MRGRLRLSRPLSNRKIQNQSFRLRRFPLPTCLKAPRLRLHNQDRRTIIRVLLLKAVARRIRTNNGLKMN